MKRPLTLTASILGTVMHGIYALSELIIFSLMIDLLGGSSVDSSSTIIIVTLALTVALTVVSLVFNALAIPAWKKEADSFKRKRGIIITAIVFNFIVLTFGLIGIFTEAPSIIDILIILTIIASNVLYIVDLGLENKRREKAQRPTEEIQQNQHEAKKSDLETKIEKLNEMKSNGLITEEEFSDLKKNYIKEKLNLP